VAVVLALTYANEHLAITGSEIMREVFQKELIEVQDRLYEMAADATRTMENASKAFIRSDVTLADQAIATSDQMASKALALDELVIRILARQSPVARDLRILVSALRISASLERMGALAGHVAQIARFRYPGSAIPEALRGTFIELGALDVELGHKLQRLLKDPNVDVAKSIQAEDQRVDELHRSVFEKVLGDDWKENAMFTVDVTLASRYHERFADHVVDISAKISYLSTGEWNDTI
jgi:phosphate transport system protein